jgi:hypothetical protein
MFASLQANWLASCRRRKRRHGAFEIYSLLLIIFNDEKKLLSNALSIKSKMRATQ